MQLPAINGRAPHGGVNAGYDNCSANPYHYLARGVYACDGSLSLALGYYGSGDPKMISPDFPHPTENLALVAPAPHREAAFLAMVDDFDAAGELPRIGPSVTLARDDFAAYLRLLDDRSRGINLPMAFVPEDVYWLVRDEEQPDPVVLGVTSLRHELTPLLEDVGGHIGYSIRPSARRRGYGTRILALALEKARERGFSRVLVTCDTDNIGSARIIVKNGGMLASEGFSAVARTRVSRYWIDLWQGG